MVWVAGGIGLILGVILTIAAMCIFFVRGTLKIDHSNPEKDTYRFELGDLDALNKKNCVILKIDHNADLR